jgi:hypothetical protein
MEKTGIGLMEILSLVAILLPLVPVFIIFINKVYKQDVLALLMGLCLVSFIQNLILYIPAFVQLDILFIQASFQLINFIILLLILKLVINGKWLHETIKILLVAFVSVVVTIYATKGISRYLSNIELVQAIFLVFLTLVALFQLIRSQDIFIFLSPPFWIAGGTLFYYSMFLLTQSIPEYNSLLKGQPHQQKKVLLLIIIFIQFIFYITAAGVSGKKNQENSKIEY